MRWSGSCLVPSLPCQAAVWVTFSQLLCAGGGTLVTELLERLLLCVFGVFSLLLRAVRNIKLFTYCN